MLGSVQSGRCHLPFGLYVCRFVLLGGKRTRGGGAVAPDWAMDSDLAWIGVAHGLECFPLDAVLLWPWSQATFARRPAAWV